MDFFDNNTLIIVCTCVIASIALVTGAGDQIPNSVVTGLIGFMGGVAVSSTTSTKTDTTDTTTETKEGEE